MHKVRITVSGGKCGSDIHKVGDEFVLAETTPGGMCFGAWNTIAPYLSALRYGANFPWVERQGFVAIRCPDPESGVIFELERIEEDDVAE